MKSSLLERIRISGERDVVGDSWREEAREALVTVQLPFVQGEATKQCKCLGRDMCGGGSEIAERKQGIRMLGRV